MRKLRAKQLGLDVDGSIITRTGGGTPFELPPGSVTQLLQVAFPGEIGWTSKIRSSDVFSCPSGVSVTDVVYVSGSLTVAKASTEAGGGQTGDGVGVVIAKPTTTTAVVVFSGVVGGFAGLTPGVVYFQNPATPGGITSTPPFTSGQKRQQVGTASSATSLIVSPAPSILIG